MYEEDLTTLDDLLRRLKVEYDIFFNGNRKRPPEDLRARLEKLVKKLSQASLMSYTERFQFNTLVARYYLYRDVWRRTVAKLELGIQKEIPPALDKSRAGTSAATSPNPELRVRLEDPESEPEKVRELYDALVRLGGAKAKEGSKISYKQFASYVTAQTRTIREKYGCSGVLFTLALEEDSIRFRAAAADRQ